MDVDAAGTDEHRLRLIERAAAGDSVALKLLLSECYPRVCERISRLIPANLRSVLDGDDIAQDAAIDVFRRVGSFQPRGPGSFYRWFATIALNRLRDAIRWARAAKRGGGAGAPTRAARSIEDSTVALLDLLAAPGHTPSQSVARGEAISAIEAALGELPELHSEAVRLVHIEGRPIAEVARRMGRTERAVQGLCRRGLRQLQEQLHGASRFFGLLE